MTDPVDPSRLDAIATRWSLVQRAHDAAANDAVEAKSALVVRYSTAVRRYVTAIVKDDDQAEELAQDVVVRMLKGDFSGADPDRGRFRDLLKTAIRNMVKNHWSKQNRRRGVDYDLTHVAEDDGEQSEGDGPWLAAWRRSVLDNTWSALEDFEREKPSTFAHTVLRLRTNHPDDTSDQLAERLSRQLGKPVRADAVRQKLRRARVRFAELLVREVADGLENATRQRIEDELIALGLFEQVKSLLPSVWQSLAEETG